MLNYVPGTLFLVSLQGLSSPCMLECIRMLYSMNHEETCRLSFENIIYTVSLTLNCRSENVLNKVELSKTISERKPGNWN